MQTPCKSLVKTSPVAICCIAPAIVPACYQWREAAQRRPRKPNSSAKGVKTPDCIKAVLSLPSAIVRLLRGQRRVRGLP